MPFFRKGRGALSKDEKDSLIRKLQVAKQRRDADIEASRVKAVKLDPIAVYKRDCGAPETQKFAQMWCSYSDDKATAVVNRSGARRREQGGKRMEPAPGRLPPLDHEVARPTLHEFMHRSTHNAAVGGGGRPPPHHQQHYDDGYEVYPAEDDGGGGYDPPPGHHFHPYHSAPDSPPHHPRGPPSSGSSTRPPLYPNSSSSSTRPTYRSGGGASDDVLLIDTPPPAPALPTSSLPPVLPIVPPVLGTSNAPPSGGGRAPVRPLHGATTFGEMVKLKESQQLAAMAIQCAVRCHAARQARQRRRRDVILQEAMDESQEATIFRAEAYYQRSQHAARKLQGFATMIRSKQRVRALRAQCDAVLDAEERAELLEMLLEDRDDSWTLSSQLIEDKHRLVDRMARYHRRWQATVRLQCFVRKVRASMAAARTREAHAAKEAAEVAVEAEEHRLHAAATRTAALI